MNAHLIFTRILLLCAFLCVRESAVAHAAAPDSRRWAKDIAAFQAEDRTNPPPQNATLFVGSSSIRFWTNLAECFPNWTLIRRGFGGSHLYDVNFYFDDLVLKYRPRRIVIYAGDNDIADGRSPDDVYADFKEFVGKVRHHLPGTEIYFLSLKLSPSRWHLSPQMKETNARIRRYARTHSRVSFIDVAATLLDPEGRPDPHYFQKDKLHVTGEGYNLWTREIQRVVKN